MRHSLSDPHRLPNTRTPHSVFDIVPHLLTLQSPHNLPNPLQLPIHNTNLHPKVSLRILQNSLLNTRTSHPNTPMIQHSSLAKLLPDKPCLPTRSDINRDLTKSWENSQQKAAISLGYRKHSSSAVAIAAFVVLETTLVSTVKHSGSLLPA